MLDRYDPRDDERARGDSFGREISQGSRGATDKRVPSTVDNRDPRDTFLRNVEMPRGADRERVRDRDRAYDLNGDESRLLPTVGAFRVVQVGDLRHAMERDGDDRKVETGRRHLGKDGLVETIRLDERQHDIVVITDAGRDLLEANRRDVDRGPRQEFHAGLRRASDGRVGARATAEKPRELSHDAQIYRAFLRAETRIRENGGRVRRVVLDHELKRDYQRFLQEGNRGQAESDGRPDRTPREIAEWAREHGLPMADDRVRFSDVRVEYEDRHGLERHEDLEVVTPHYRGAHAASARSSGFTCFAVGGGTSGGRGGRGRHSGLADEFLG
jgi:hypothetical protein